MIGKYFGLDLSYSGTGIVHYNFDSENVNPSLFDFDSCLVSVTPLGKKNFTTLYSKATESTEQTISFLKNHLSQDLIENTHILIEHPIPTSQFSSGLWLLTTKVVDSIKSLGIEGVYLSPVSLLSSIAGKKRTKKDLLNYANQLTKELNLETIKNDNIGDAFLHSLMLVKNYPSMEIVLNRCKLKDKYDKISLSKYYYKSNKTETIDNVR